MRDSEVSFNNRITTIENRGGKVLLGEYESVLAAIEILEHVSKTSVLGGNAIDRLEKLLKLEDGKPCDPILRTP